MFRNLTFFLFFKNYQCFGVLSLVYPFIEIIIHESKKHAEKARVNWEKLLHLNKWKGASNPGAKNWDEKKDSPGKKKVWSTPGGSNTFEGGILKEKCFSFTGSIDERGSNKTFKHIVI